MTEKDKQLAEEFNIKITELERFLDNLTNDVENLLIDKNDLDSLSLLITNLRKKIDNLENNSHSEEE
jgi:polyhydroxyalkanoate synthesis regulator phasin|tara:strand:+ start:252 stop:452 length:201 start_codon:yes stop_codon:yes gene_type:complete